MDGERPHNRNGVKNMNTTKKINGEWSKYDRMVASSQLVNYGVIFLDEYDLPIDDEYELEELNQRRK